MKLLYLLIIVYAMCTRGLSKFPDAMKERCAMNSNNKFAYFELQYAMAKLPECNKIGGEGLRPEILLGTVDGTCEYLKKTSSIPCVNYLLRNKLAPCLHPEEKSLIDFIFHSFVSTLDVMCSAYGREKLKKFTSASYSDKCDGGDPSDPIVLSKCYLKTKLAKWLFENNNILTKEDLCSDVDFLNTCMVKVLQEECKADYTEIVTTILGPMTDACSN